MAVHVAAAETRYEMKICRNLFHLITYSRFNVEAASFLHGSLGYHCRAELFTFYPHAKWAALDAKGAAHIFWSIGCH